MDEELHDVWFEKVPELDIASVVPAPIHDVLVLRRPSQPHGPNNGLEHGLRNLLPVVQDVCSDAEFRASTDELCKPRLLLQDQSLH